MKTKIQLLSTAIVAVLLGGCGAGSFFASEQKAHFVDPLVKGLPYTCGSKSGVTDDYGAFEYEKGSVCKFTIGDFSFEANAASLEDGILTPYEIGKNEFEAQNLSWILDSVSDTYTDVSMKINQEKAAKLPKIDLNDSVNNITLKFASYDIHYSTREQSVAKLDSYANKDGSLKKSLNELKEVVKSAYTTKYPHMSEYYGYSNSDFIEVIEDMTPSVCASNMNRDYSPDGAISLENSKNFSLGTTLGFTKNKYGLLPIFDMKGLLDNKRISVNKDSEVAIEIGTTAVSNTKRSSTEWALGAEGSATGALVSGSFKDTYRDRTESQSGSSAVTAFLRHSKEETHNVIVSDMGFSQNLEGFLLGSALGQEDLNKIAKLVKINGSTETEINTATDMGNISSADHLLLTILDTDLFIDTYNELIKNDETFHAVKEAQAIKKMVSIFNLGKKRQKEHYNANKSIIDQWINEKNPAKKEEFAKNNEAVMFLYTDRRKGLIHLSNNIKFAIDRFYDRHGEAFVSEIVAAQAVYADGQLKTNENATLKEWSNAASISVEVSTGATSGFSLGAFHSLAKSFGAGTSKYDLNTKAKGLPSAMDSKAEGYLKYLVELLDSGRKNAAAPSLPTTGVSQAAIPDVVAPPVKTQADRLKEISDDSSTMNPVATEYKNKIFGMVQASTPADSNTLTTVTVPTPDPNNANGLSISRAVSRTIGGLGLSREELYVKAQEELEALKKEIQSSNLCFKNVVSSRSVDNYREASGYTVANTLTKKYETTNYGDVLPFLVPDLDLTVGIDTMADSVALPNTYTAYASIKGMMQFGIYLNLVSGDAWTKATGITNGQSMRDAYNDTVLSYTEKLTGEINRLKGGVDLDGALMLRIYNEHFVNSDSILANKLQTKTRYFEYIKFLLTDPSAKKIWSVAPGGYAPFIPAQKTDTNNGLAFMWLTQEYLLSHLNPAGGFYFHFNETQNFNINKDISDYYKESAQKGYPQSPLFPVYIFDETKSNGYNLVFIQNIGKHVIAWGQNVTATGFGGSHPTLGRIYDFGPGIGDKGNGITVADEVPKWECESSWLGLIEHCKKVYVKEESIQNPYIFGDMGDIHKVLKDQCNEHWISEASSINSVQESGFGDKSFWGASIYPYSSSSDSARVKDFEVFVLTNNSPSYSWHGYTQRYENKRSPCQPIKDESVVSVGLYQMRGAGSGSMFQNTNEITLTKAVGNSIQQIKTVKLNDRMFLLPIKAPTNTFSTSPNIEITQRAFYHLYNKNYLTKGVK